MKLWAFWLVLILVAPQLRLISWAQAPDGSDLEQVFGDAPRYLAYADAMLGRSYDAFYVRAPEKAGGVEPLAHAIVTPLRPLTPWRDFSFEYPPGALLAILPPALASDRVEVFYSLFSIEMALALTAAVGLGVAAAETLRPGKGADTLLFSLVYFAAGSALGAGRSDALVALSFAGFAYGIASGRSMLTALALVFGVLVKGVPALLVPLALIHVFEHGPRGRGALALAASALVLAAAGGLYLVVAGPRAFDMLAYHAARPVQIESPYGAVALILRALGVAPVQIVNSFGSENIVAGFEPALRSVAGAASATALLAVFLWRLRRREPDETERALRTLSAAGAAVIAFIGLGKFFSPQYLVWLLPLAIVPAAVSNGVARKILIAAALATQLEFPFAYHFSLALLGPVALVRDGLLLTAAACLLSSVRSRPREIRAGAVVDPAG